MSYSTIDLLPGYPYRFTVQAIDGNGYSDENPISTFYSCYSPSNFATPTYSDSDWTAKTIDIGWQAPGSSGGCPIMGYILYMDDGIGGSISTVDATLASNDPSIFSH
jgi:hypothetical protein